MKSKELVEYKEYNHNGSFWKSIGLCIRGVFSVAGFAAMWWGIIMFEAERNGWALGIGVAAFTAVFIFNLLLPLVKFWRN